MENQSFFLSFALISEGLFSACRREDWPDGIWIWPDADSDTGILAVQNHQFFEFEAAPEDLHKHDWLIV